MRRPALVCVLLVLGTFAAFLSVRHAVFLNWDDDQYVTTNPEVFRGFSPQSVRWAFTTSHACNWHPLTWLSHMLDCQLFGDRAGMHHLVNVGFHAANALLLFLLLLKLTGAMVRSGWVAALFAVHPLHVESVAWISERKDVLSTFFLLLTLWFYRRYVLAKGEAAAPFDGQARATRKDALMGGPRTTSALRAYCWSLAFFICGLLSKPMLVTLPFALLLLDYWPLRRLQAEPGRSWAACMKPLLVETLPFFLLSLVSSWITFQVQKTGGAVVKTEAIPVLARLANAALSYCWYLGKLFWPTNLGPLYPFPREMTLTPGTCAAAFLLTLTVLAWRSRRRAPYLLVGWLLFLGMLVPVIGLVQVGSATRADRYTYFPMVGILLLVSWGMAELLKNRRYGRVLLAGFGSFAIVACFLATTVQVQYWRDSIMLFERALAVAPDNNALAQHNLAHALSLAGNQRAAIPHFREALAEHPDFAVAHLNWGNSVGIQGKLDEAIVQYREAIRCSPKYEQAYYQLANSLALELKIPEAKTNFLMAVRCTPAYPEAHTRLGNLLVLSGDESHGLEHLQEAVRLRPDYDEGQYYLGSALAREGKFSEAVACFRAAIKVTTNYAAALNDLAWVLGTQLPPGQRAAPEALEFARRACQATRELNPGYLDTLAVLESENGHFKEAVAITQRAAALAEGQGNAALAGQLRERIPLYQSGKSYTASRRPNSS